MVLGFGMLLIAGGVWRRYRVQTAASELLEFVAVVTGIVGFLLVWFRTFRIEVSQEAVDYRSLWARRRWLWNEIERGYVASRVAPGPWGGLRPSFRITLLRADGGRLDIPYNVFGLTELYVIIERLRRDGKLTDASSVEDG